MHGHAGAVSWIWNFRFWHETDIAIPADDVGYGANNGLNSDIATCPFCANAQSRCAPARCAGARIERPVVEDSTGAGELRPEN